MLARRSCWQPGVADVIGVGAGCCVVSSVLTGMVHRVADTPDWWVSGRMVLRSPPGETNHFDPAAFDLAEVNTALSGFAAILIES